MSSFSLPENS